MTEQTCKHGLGYYKRFDGPLSKIDALPHYKNLHTCYEKDYEKKQSQITKSDPETKEHLERIKNPKKSSALPLTYHTNYGGEFWGKKPGPDSRAE